VRVVFDPRVVSYEKLVAVFYQDHTAPTKKAHQFSRQYRSAILYSSPNQKAIAESVTRAMEKRIGKRILTDIEPLGEYYLAEQYHQKYYFHR